MFDPTRIYALDIETDNSPGRNGLDPANSSITEVCVVTDPSVADGGIYLSGSERSIIDGLQNFLSGLEPGLIVTWNGTFFDFPFINDRILPSGSTLPIGLRLDPVPTLRPKYDALPGHAHPGNPLGGYQVTWEVSREFGLAHAHLDVSQAYRRYAAATGVKWGLKPVCEALGIDMVTDVDREHLERFSAAQRKAYNVSDGLGTRALALRLLGLDYTPYAG